MRNKHAITYVNAPEKHIVEDGFDGIDSDRAGLQLVSYDPTRVRWNTFWSVMEDLDRMEKKIAAALKRHHSATR